MESDSAAVKEKNKRKFRVLMLGFDHSGKTTILYRLKLGQVIAAVPTMGFNAETIISNDAELTIWDIGGSDRIRVLWTHYTKSTDGLIYVVDSSDVNRLEDTKSLLASFVKSNELENIPVLLLCNKQDLPDAMTPMRIKENLELQNNLFAKGCCGTTAEGLNEGIEWLTDCMLKSPPKESPIEENPTESQEQNIRESPEITEEAVPSAKKNYKVLLIGLDISGKTTILYRLKLGETISTLPTIGFNVETINYKNSELTIWDLGGSEKIRPLWRHYTSDIDGIIFAVDSSDPENLSQSKELLSSFITEHQLENIPLLVYCNKQDLNNAKSVIEIHQKLELKNNYFLVACCAITGNGLSQGVEWLASNMDKGKEEDKKENSVEAENIEQREGTEKNAEEKLEGEKVENEQKKFRVLMVGLDNSGKTTILYRVKIGEFISTIPTIGFNVESIVSNNAELTIWDVGGIDRIRALWRHYIEGTDGLIFVIDSSDISRITESKECLVSFLKDYELEKIPLLIILNKQDLPGTISPMQLKEEIDLKNEYVIIGCSGYTGDGLNDAISWLSDMMNR